MPWRDYGRAMFVAAAAALVLRGMVLQTFKIPSGSMLPTLQVGDHVLVNQLRYGVPWPFVGGWIIRYGRPRPGEVIVFKNRSQDFIKRVIAVEGEVVEIRNKRVLINGRRRDLPEVYLAEGADHVLPGSPRDNFGPVVVPPDQVFVLGDNRDQSYDSRFWGFVDMKDVAGRAELLCWSWDGRDRWMRWERLGRRIE